ncbi:hypothetical protein D3C72_2200460 [compost metagenome]
MAVMAVVEMARAVATVTVTVVRMAMVMVTVMERIPASQRTPRIRATFRCPTPIRLYRVATQGNGQAA